MLRGYKQGFSTHHASVKLIESWRQSLDQAGYHGADLNDLLKAFHKLNYDPLIENFHVYGFSKESLKVYSIILLIDGKDSWQFQFLG